jgi:hypothetical protein
MAIAYQFWARARPAGCQCHAPRSPALPFLFLASRVLSMKRMGSTEIQLLTYVRPYKQRYKRVPREWCSLIKPCNWQTVKVHLVWHLRAANKDNCSN